MALTLFSCLTAFLVGGIPFGYLAGRFVLKDDIRRHGSGNIGATNVGRVLGWKWGSLVLVLDALKGLLPTLGTRILAGQYLSEQAAVNAAIAAGMSAIAGHMYPVYLRLRGGKGVATALGVVLVIAPISSVFALLAFATTAALTRVVALASILAAIVFAGAQLIRMGGSAWTADALPLTVFSVAVPSLIVWRHRSNIRRLLHGEEQPWKSGAPEAAAGQHTPEQPTAARDLTP